MTSLDRHILSKIEKEVWIMIDVVQKLAVAMSDLTTATSDLVTAVGGIKGLPVLEDDDQAAIQAAGDQAAAAKASIEQATADLRLIGSK